ncbi:hypothetical protein GCM10010124_02420 [Pilimelia terevasa]|uniref:Zinc finger CHC2-type domain-containing protein n=1 Tax=Pilimelia terevasa TaxID=53372 RepID=A0A8J3BIF0_9ACTN|nr:CHC2 zinc finger domain-containing protein [Pilimelia terevasa]GGK13392.1 hypothetical protein GCM10010124_02420 [Pilimelia terevasa]
MSEEARPDLEATLDHYQVRRISGRPTTMASCPLHPDRTPSMSIDLNKGLWRCHSCGKAGDSYSLIMEVEGVDFPRARALAASIGLATRDPGGSDEQLSGSRYGARRHLPGPARDRPGKRGYVPAWRRR